MLAASPSVRSRACAVTAAIAVTVVRLQASVGRRMFHVWPDEPAQLGIARFLGGGARWSMHNHSTWRPGYGTLLAPVYRFTDDPETVFRTALALNAALGGVSAILLYLVARRLTTLGPIGAAVVSAIAMTAPAVAFSTGYAWSESLVQALFLGTLVALLWFRDRPTAGRGLAAGVLVAAGFVTHTRLLPLAVVLAVVVAAELHRRRLRWQSAVAVLSATAAGLVIAAWYSSWIVDRLWNEPSTENKSVRDVLGQLAYPGDILIALAGQVWYQLVATAGLVGIGAVLVARAALSDGPGRDGTDRPSARDARLVAVSIAALVCLAVLFISDGSRADHLVYGRYNDAIAAPLAVVGLASFATARLATIAASLCGAAAAAALIGHLLLTFRPEQLADLGVRPMTLGLQAFHGDAGEIRVASITLALAAMCGALLAAAALARSVRLPAVGLVAVAALTGIGHVRTAEQLDRNRNAWAGASSVTEAVHDIAPAGTSLSYLLPEGSNRTVRMMAIQFYLPHHRIEVVHDVDELIGSGLDRAGASPLLFAPDDHPELLARGAVTLWSDPQSSTALWATDRAALPEA